MARESTDLTWSAQQKNQFKCYYFYNLMNQNTVSTCTTKTCHSKACTHNPLTGIWPSIFRHGKLNQC